MPAKAKYITGHTGLIGSAALRRFGADERYRILTVTHRELELQDAVAVRCFFEDNSPDYVILAAGKVGGILENKTHPADFISGTLAIQLNVLAAARQVGVKKLLLFASSCMYPRECPQPMSEHLLFPGRLKPTSMAYDLSIRELAELVAAAAGCRGAIAWDTTRPDGAPRKLLDSRRLHATEWGARIPLQAGIVDTYAWYQKDVIITGAGS